MSIFKKIMTALGWYKMEKCRVCHKWSLSPWCSQWCYDAAKRKLEREKRFAP